MLNKKKSIIGYVDSDWKLGFKLYDGVKVGTASRLFKLSRDGRRKNGDIFRKPVKIRLTIEEI